MASAASRIIVASSSPPPMVPAMEPSGRTSICAPAALGVEPCCATSVTRANGSPLVQQAQRLVQDLTHGSADRRQPHREHGPALRAVGGLDDAALGLDETAGDGEAEADALRAPRRL